MERIWRGLFLRFMSAFCIPQRAPPLLKPLKVATIACIINQDRWYNRRGRRHSRTVVYFDSVRVSSTFYLRITTDVLRPAYLTPSVPSSVEFFQFRTFYLVDFVQFIRGTRECSGSCKISEESVRTSIFRTKKWGSYDVRF